MVSKPCSFSIFATLVASYTCLVLASEEQVQQNVACLTGECLSDIADVSGLLQVAGRVEVEYNSLDTSIKKTSSETIEDRRNIDSASQSTENIKNIIGFSKKDQDSAKIFDNAEVRLAELAGEAELRKDCFETVKDCLKAMNGKKGTIQKPQSKEGEEHHADDEHPEGNMISNAIGSDLLGDALEPSKAGGKQKIKHEHGHGGYAVLVFLFGGLTVGSVLLMLHERYLHALPYTVLLFMTGCLVAFIHNTKPFGTHTWNSWYASVAIWKHIDPHLFFYIFLPALVFSDAMRLNKHMVKSCLGQILLLAGPGVLVGAGAVGAIAHYCLPYGWDWPLCLVVGSILSATDPVAVVSLFNSLGVSPRLTMIISGESLLNDGTAIVVFTLMMKVVLGADLTFPGVAFFFGNMTIISCILGFVAASLALLVIGACSHGHGHSDAMIQVVTTVSCSYLCFFIAESELSTSGILSLVAAGYVLAYASWPRFVSREVVHIVWEAIEFVGNTMVFLLAGLLFADSILSRKDLITSSDLNYLLLMYLACMVVRLLIIVVFWVPLRTVGEAISLEEGMVLTWSGLRGAVSLVMAIIVDAEKEINKRDGTRVLFLVGGIAALTLLINATLTEKLLVHLGLTREPEERRRLTEHLHEKIAQKTKTAFMQLTPNGGEDDSAEVMRPGIIHGAVDLDGDLDLRFANAAPSVVLDMVPMMAYASEGKLSTGASDRLELTTGVPKSEEYTRRRAERCREYRQIFLDVVHDNYWQSIDEGIIPRDSKVARVLLSSKDEAKMHSAMSLHDWPYILQRVNDKPPAPGSLWEWLANSGNHRLLVLIPGWRHAVHNHIPTAEVIQTWQIMAVLSYQEAHKRARAEVPQFFGGLDDLDLEVQRIVADESRENCKEAGHLLDSIPEAEVSFGQSRMLAQKLLRLQLEEVHLMNKKGVLSSTEHHHMKHSINQAIHRVQRVHIQHQDEQAVQRVASAKKGDTSREPSQGRTPAPKK